MSTNPPGKLGHSLGALQQLDRLLGANPKVLAKLASTQADRDYLVSGLGLAVRQLQFLREHEAAVMAAVNAYRQAAGAETGARS